MIVKEKKYIKSEFIWKKGERPDSVYIVKEGECVYEKSDFPTNFPTKIVRSGEFIGETLAISKK